MFAKKTNVVDSWAARWCTGWRVPAVFRALDKRNAHGFTAHRPQLAKTPLAVHTSGRVLVLWCNTCRTDRGNHRAPLPVVAWEAFVDSNPRRPLGSRPWQRQAPTEPRFLAGYLTTGWTSCPQASTCLSRRQARFVLPAQPRGQTMRARFYRAPAPAC